ncbi:MAG TPA: prepilin-type N-terminal cleavage/methylation domain-containing protein [Candidatus Limnocylindrales bacterium]|jgi:prepilin-type N-terminal cleavage/methylation domain-containing protein|nr:prepilin-type N-terminal cleavage/methylation domain-containing protein [Candidatus Limnocylindrales bacterium]
MYIKAASRTKRAFTLVEMMVGVAIFSIAGLALSTIFIFSIRSYAAMANYALLDQKNRQAMDQLTYEIRQARKVVGYTTNANSSSLTINNGAGDQVTYTFNSASQTVSRASSDGSNAILLTNCALLNFNLYMRPPTNGTFDVYPINVSNNWQTTVKVVQLSWKTSMSIPPARITSEDIQTARIVIRKQQD